MCNEGEAGATMEGWKDQWYEDMKNRLQFIFSESMYCKRGRHSGLGTRTNKCTI